MICNSITIVLPEAGATKCLSRFESMAFLKGFGIYDLREKSARKDVKDMPASVVVVRLSQGKPTAL